MPHVLPGFPGHEAGTSAPAWAATWAAGHCHQGHNSGSCTRGPSTEVTWQSCQGEQEKGFLFPTKDKLGKNELLC